MAELGRIFISALAHRTSIMHTPTHKQTIIKQMEYKIPVLNNILLFIYNILNDEKNKKIHKQIKKKT